MSKISNQVNKKENLHTALKTKVTLCCTLK